MYEGDIEVTMSIYIIGAGMGDTKILTVEAMEKIEKAHIIIGAKRIVEPYKLGKEVYFEYEAEKITDIINKNKDKNIALLFSGDVSFFSGAKKLMNIYPQAEVICGISSMSYFASKIGISYEDMKIVSLHGREGNIVSAVRRNKYTFVLLGDNPCEKLCQYGMGDRRVWIGENLSYENEKIHTGTAEDFRDTKIEPLSVMVIENDKAKKSVEFGIDDGFIRGEVPMTKSEVRAVTMSKLRVNPTDIVYDIGAGTGSVSVECALAAYEGKVYAIEKNKEGANLVRQNALKFQCDNIEVVEGVAPDILKGLPKPDKVFIGGSSGAVKEIIKICDSGRVVVNAITLETLEGTLKAFDELGYEYEALQISAAKSHKVGGYNMMKAQNSVFIITGKKVGN